MTTSASTPLLQLGVGGALVIPAHPHRSLTQWKKT